MEEFEKIAKWIAENYPNAKKIIEVGIGKTSYTMDKLKEFLSQTTLIATDSRKVSVPKGIKFKLDDITNPDMSIYQNADLIYSLRIPPELYPPIFELAEQTNSDVLVKPVSSEEAPPKGKLINYSGTSFYLLNTSRGK